MFYKSIGVRPLMNENILKPLFNAVTRLLRPLVRILLRNGVSFQTFSDLAKWVYVDVARKDFNISGRKQSKSRVSVITGLSRKEVARVGRLRHPDDLRPIEKYNRASRVIAAWKREERFLDSDNKPAPLPVEGSGASFSSLVKDYSGDMPVRATLDELLHIGAVTYAEGGNISLRVQAYIPERSEVDKLHILGTDAGQLISTIDHNLKSGARDPFFQRKVAYDNLPDEVLPKFRKLSAKQAQQLLERFDHWLAQNDRDVTPAIEGSGRNYAGIGIYYFEEPYFDEEK